MTAPTSFEEKRPQLQPLSDCFRHTLLLRNILSPPQRLLNYELYQLCMNGAYYKKQTKFSNDNCARTTAFAFMALAPDYGQASEACFTQFLLFSSLVVTVKAEKAP